MIHFQECDVIINGTGLTADSASISQDNSLVETPVIGYSNVQLIPNGSIVNTIQINYKPVVNKEPNFKIAEYLKTFQSGLNPVNIEIAGIECSGYLTSLSISSNPNQTLNASVSYISFFPTNGYIMSKRDTVDYTLDPYLLGHGWTTVINYGNTGFYPTYSFNYSINFNYIPIYAIGDKFPKQVILVGGDEKVSMVKENYLSLDFNGATGVSNLISSFDESFNIYELSRYNNQNNPFISLNFRDCKITNSTLKAAIDDYVKTEITAERNF